MLEKFCEEILNEVEDWAAGQKRITNKMIRDHLDVTEDEADDVYTYLRDIGLVAPMGYVNRKLG